MNPWPTLALRDSWKEVPTSPLSQEHLLSAFHRLHTYHIPFIMHSHQGPPDVMGKPVVFTSKVETGPQGRYLTLKCTSAKPGKAGGGLVSRREAVQQRQSSWKATRPFPKYRCLLRQKEASYFQTSPLAQHNWDPRPGTIRCRIAPDLLCIRCSK